MGAHLTNDGDLAVATRTPNEVVLFDPLTYAQTGGFSTSPHVAFSGDLDQFAGRVRR